EVRVRVAWAALNHLDTWVRRGVPGHRFPLPMTLGCDFSGVVDACGPGVADFAPGTRVAVAPGHSCGRCVACASGRHNLCGRFGIYGETCDGGDADFAVVKAENLMPLPDAFPLDLAAAFPLTYLTAWHMLISRCGLRPGEKVLIHAAGSGVSVAATQIARLWGAEVMVTAGSDDKIRRAMEQGASAGVNYRDADWSAAAKQWAGGNRLDLIVDHVGADTLPKGLWLLARGGRVVTCGVTSGAEMELNLAPLFFKSLSVLGSTMGGLGDQKEVAAHVFAGRLKPVIDSRFPLEEAAAAHRKLADRDVYGKVLLEVDASLA
ncbi:MAG: zinc-binding dehydrogenase, partial [Planctomycetes bacterium]|nr:zinc-binding dehydrogenase [Planctomycetota bacterium]